MFRPSRSRSWMIRSKIASQSLLRAKLSSVTKNQWKLIRLHADQPDHAEAVVALELRDDVLDVDPRIGFVHRADIDRAVRAEHMPRGGIAGQRIDGGE